MFDNFLIFPPLGFKEREEKKPLNSKTVKKRFSKHFADIFRVQKWMNSLYCDFLTGCGNSANFARFYWMGFKKEQRSG